MSDKEMNLAIENKLQHTIDDVSFMIKSIVAFDSVDTLYLGMSSSHAAVATNSLGNIYLLMPAVYEDRGYFIDNRYVPFNIDVLEERANERTNEPSEDVIPAKVDNVTTEEKEFREHQNIPCFKFPHVSPAYMDIHAEYTSESIWGLGTFEYFYLTKSNLDVLLDFIRIITSK